MLVDKNQMPVFRIPVNAYRHLKIGANHIVAASNCGNVRVLASVNLDGLSLSSKICWLGDTRILKTNPLQSAPPITRPNTPAITTTWRCPQCGDPTSIVVVAPWIDTSLALCSDCAEEQWGIKNTTDDDKIDLSIAKIDETLARYGYTWQDFVDDVIAFDIYDEIAVEAVTTFKRKLADAIDNAVYHHTIWLREYAKQPEAAIEVKKKPPAKKQVAPFKQTSLF